MKLKQKTEVSKKSAKKSAKKTDDAVGDLLAEMSREELKKFISKEELEVKVYKSDTEVDIRNKIADALGVCHDTAADEGETEDSETEGEADAEESEESEESEEAGEAEGDEIDLDELDRSALKKFIAENELSVKVMKSDSDDDIRKKIKEAVEALEEASSESEDAEESSEDAEESSEEDAEESSEESEAADPSPASAKKKALAWMFTGDRMVKETKHSEQQRMKQFAPEFWVPDGDSAIVRLRSDEPICGLYMYSVNDGKRWRKVTAPADEKDDKLSASGKRAQYNLVYEVINRTGFTNKKGQKFKDIPQFWLVNDRIHKQLQHIRSKIQSLTKTDLEIHREGGQKPVYTMMPDKSLSPLSAKAKEQPRLAGEVAKFYAPPSVEEQRRMLRFDEEAEQSSD